MYRQLSLPSLAPWVAHLECAGGYRNHLAWESGSRERTVWIPPGDWVDFWDRETTIEGPVETDVAAPLGKLPMWVPADSDLLELEVDDELVERATNS